MTGALERAHHTGQLLYRWLTWEPVSQFLMRWNAPTAFLPRSVGRVSSILYKSSRSQGSIIASLGADLQRCVALAARFPVALARP